MNNQLTKENLKKLQDELDYRMTVKRAEIAKEKMIATYDNQIATLDTTDPMAAVELVHNKEALVFDGNDDLLFSNLQ